MGHSGTEEHQATTPPAVHASQRIATFSSSALRLLPNREDGPGVDHRTGRPEAPATERRQPWTERRKLDQANGVRCAGVVH